GGGGGGGSRCGAGAGRRAVRRSRDGDHQRRGKLAGGGAPLVGARRPRPLDRARDPRAGGRRQARVRDGVGRRRARQHDHGLHVARRRADRRRPQARLPAARGRRAAARDLGASALGAQLRREPVGGGGRSRSAPVIACSAVRPDMTDTERDLWRLIEVTKAITASLDLDQVLGLIVDAAVSVLTAASAVIVLLDDQRRPHLRSERTRRPSRSPTTKYSQTFIDKVLQTGEPAFVLDRDLAREVRSDSVQTLGLRTIACAPLRSRGEILGVLYAHSTHPVHAFTEQKKQLFLTLCDHASIAINNAQLYQMRELAQASSEGVLMIEHDQIQLCNHAAHTLMQRSEEQTVGRSVLT